MPASNSNPTKPAWLRPGSKPLAYCHGFMAGLNHALDDELILDVLTPVFGESQTNVSSELDLNAAALFMAGLFDGVSEYRRLSADPLLYRNWSEFLNILESLMLDTATESRCEGKND